MVFDPVSGESLLELAGHENWVNSLAMTDDGRLALSASSDCTVKIWDLTTGKEDGVLIGHVAGVRSVAVTADGSQAVSASSDGTLKRWDLG